MTGTTLTPWLCARLAMLLSLCGLLGTAPDGALFSVGAVVAAALSTATLIEVRGLH